MEQIPLKWNGKQCGVYCIRNLGNGKIYIGSSKNCYHRVRSQHFDKLQRGTHHNPHLQSSWNKYGKANFESFCVEICESSMLSDKEQGWIDKTNCLDPKIGYNINPYADRVELTPEQCKRVSLGKIGKPRRDGIPSGIIKRNNKYGESWYVVLTFRNHEHCLGNFKKLSTAIDVRNYALPRIVAGEEMNWKWINSLRTNKGQRDRRSV